MTLEEIKDNFNEKNRFVATIGAKVTVLREGYAEVEMVISESHLNTNGTLHGGVLFTLADSAAGAASKSYGCGSTTLEGKFNYIRPGVGVGITIKAVAETCHQGKTTGVCESKVYDDQGKLLAMGIFTMFLFR